MSGNETRPLSERVAILETLVPEVREAVRVLQKSQGSADAKLNTLLVEMASLTTTLRGIVAERTIWKNPLVWTNAASLCLALFLAYRK